MIRCRVTIRCAAGRISYFGLFASTVDAVIDAQERAGAVPCAISARAAR